MSRNQSGKSEKDNDSHRSDKKNSHNKTDRYVSSPRACKPGSHVRFSQNSEEIKPSSWDNSDEEFLTNDWDSPTPRFKLNRETISYDLTSPESRIPDFFNTQTPKVSEEIPQTANNSTEIDRRQSPARIRRRTKSSSSSSPLLETKNEPQASNPEVSLDPSMKFDNFRTSLDKKIISELEDESSFVGNERKDMSENESKNYSSLEELKNSFDDDSAYHRRIFTKLSQILENEEIKKDPEDDKLPGKFDNHNEPKSSRNSNTSPQITNRDSDSENTEASQEAPDQYRETKKSPEVQNKVYFLQKFSNLGEFDNFEKSYKFKGSLSDRYRHAKFNELYSNEDIFLTEKRGEIRIDPFLHKNDDFNIREENTLKPDNETNFHNNLDLELGALKEENTTSLKNSYRSDESLKGIKAFDKQFFESPRFSINIGSSRTVRLGETMTPDSIEKITGPNLNHTEVTPQYSNRSNKSFSSLKQKTVHSRSSVNSDSSVKSFKSDVSINIKTSGRSSKRSKITECDRGTQDIKLDRIGEDLDRNKFSTCIEYNTENTVMHGDRKSENQCKISKSPDNTSERNTDNSKTHNSSRKLGIVSNDDLSCENSVISTKTSRRVKSNRSSRSKVMLETSQLQNCRSPSALKTSCHIQNVEKSFRSVKNISNKCETERKLTHEIVSPVVRLSKSLENYSSNQKPEELISNLNKFIAYKNQDKSQSSVDTVQAVTPKPNNVKTQPENLTANYGESIVNSQNNFDEENWGVHMENFDKTPRKTNPVTDILSSSSASDSSVEKTKLLSDGRKFPSKHSKHKNKSQEELNKTAPSKSESAEKIMTPPIIENTVTEPDNKGLLLQCLQNVVPIREKQNEILGIGEFGDVSSLDTGTSETAFEERPKDHGDGVLSGYAIKLRQRRKSSPRKSWTQQTSSILSGTKKDIPRQDLSYFVETCLIFNNLKTSKSESSIYKSKTHDIQFENTNTTIYLDEEITDIGKLDLGCQKQSLGSKEKIGQSQRLKYTLRSDPESNLQIPKEEILESPTMPKNWLILKDRQKKKRGKKKMQDFSKYHGYSNKNDLTSTWRTQNSVASMKLRNSGCLRKFYKRLVSVFCITSESSAASSK